MPTYLEPDAFAQACAAELRGLLPAEASHSRGREFVIGTVTGFQLYANADGWTLRLNGVLYSQRANLASPLSNFQAAVAYLNPKPEPARPPIADFPAGHDLEAGSIVHLVERVATRGGGIIARQDLVDNTTVTVLVLGKTVGRTPTPSEVDELLLAAAKALFPRLPQQERVG